MQDIKQGTLNTTTPITYTKSNMEHKRKACKESNLYRLFYRKYVDYAFLKRSATASQFTTFQKAEI